MCNLQLFILSCLKLNVWEPLTENAFVYIILYIAAQRLASVDKFLIGLEIALLLLLLAFSKLGMAINSDT